MSGWEYSPLCRASLLCSHPPNYPNDPYCEYQWGLHNTGDLSGIEDADIDAPEAWDITTGSNEVVVAVIDTGVDYTHEDLAANMWRNPGEIPNNNRDDDGNGYVDDIYGIDIYNNDSDPKDDHFHGTHVAGIIGAVGNNGKGIVGVNWQVKIMALKFLSSEGEGTVDDAIECFEYVANIYERSRKFHGCTPCYWISSAFESPRSVKGLEGD